MLLSSSVTVGASSLQANWGKKLSVNSARGSLPSLLPRHRTSLARVQAVQATADEDAELEKRLEKLRLAKGATPYGQGVKDSKGVAEKSEPGPSSPAPKASSKVAYDFSGETLFYEGTPHLGDLVVNLALGTTLVWLPLTFAAVGRCAFVKYRFTDKRFSITTNSPFKNEHTDVAYQEVQSIVTVGRGIGLWGDMVVTLKDKSKVELRSLDKFLELKNYILERRDALGGGESSGSGSGESGFLSTEELMGEPQKVGAKGGKKGFA